ncbi:hypothetical protein SAMN04489747_0553 [Auraticoccus monumenti]|uniref:Uncharacterized protein n=1 Tax=Auraticoccus monumenti TaxID=675864 RepID=A0A1G6T805_9ACTN|nr:hypothetical protein SAMN04489747_0553 [Auraticoccus monumenti]
MLLVAGVLLAVAACTSSPEDDEARARQRAVEWLGEQSSVERAVVEPTVHEDDAEDWIRVETTAGLPDADVLALVDQMQDRVHSHDRYDDTVLLSVDGFETLLYPSSGHQVLHPALWLRGDGRAESGAVGDYPSYVVTAAPCNVFRLVGDYDEEAGPQPRATRVVQSADGTARVQWTRADELGMQLPRAAVGQLVDLCAQHPGTRGWVEGVTGDIEEVSGGVLLDPGDIGLDEVLADVESLVDPSAFSQPLILGWGGLRAGADVFADTFRGERREWAEIALDAGADGVLGPPEGDGQREPAIRQVQVSDLGAWGAVHDRLYETAGNQYLPIHLFRGRPAEDAVSTVREIHSSSPLPAGSTTRTLVSEVAAVAALRQVSTVPVIRLVVEGSASDADLDRLLGATAEAYPRFEEGGYVVDGFQAEFTVVEGFGKRESYRVVGTVVDGEFVPAPQSAGGSKLVERYADAWERVS